MSSLETTLQPQMRRVGDKETLMICLVTAVALVLLSAPHTASAQVESAADSLVTISLTDGTSITGSIVAEDDDSLQIVTAAGLKVMVPRASVVAIKPAKV